MTTLVIGASGATGSLVVEHLLNSNHIVKAMLRSPEKFPEFKKRKNLTLIGASVLDLTEKELAQHVKDCDAVVSCLGHNLTFKGMYGQPRRLVCEAARNTCKAIEANQPEKPVRFVLMNTTANRNRDLHEPMSFAEKCVFALIRLLIPPHVDNEQAADFLRTRVKNNPWIEWTAVRPDGLIDEDTVSDYEIYPSLMRSPVFNAGKVSRTNVAHFMAQLATNTNLWNKWKGQMPVIYSKG